MLRRVFSSRPLRFALWSGTILVVAFTACVLWRVDWPWGPPVAEARMARVTSELASMLKHRNQSQPTQAALQAEVDALRKTIGDPKQARQRVERELERMRRR